MNKTISVIGSGVAGLASAIRLQTEGYQVTIYEKEKLPGGKMNQIKKDGYTFDLGPSIVMMPEIYREVFEIAGKNPNDYIPMKRLEPMYTSFYGEQKNKSLPFSSDLVTLQKMFEEINPGDFNGFLKYLSDIYSRFEIARDHFLQQPFLKWSDFYNPSTLYNGYKLKTLNTTSKMLDDYMDIGEDYRDRQRIYLPQSYMEEYGYSEQDLANNSINNSFKKMWESLAEEAEKRYENFFRYLDQYDASTQEHIRKSALVYKEILNIIRENNYDCLTKRQYVPMKRMKEITS